MSSKKSAPKGAPKNPSSSVRTSAQKKIKTDVPQGARQKAQPKVQPKAQPKAQTKSKSPWDKAKRVEHTKVERETYAHPVPDRDQILALIRQVGVPMDQDEIMRALKTSSVEEKEGMRRRLIAMVRDGQLIRNRKDHYLEVNSQDLVKGRVAGHPDGFGFLEPADGSPSLTLNARQMRRVMHGDEAVARVSGLDHRGRKVGEIVEVLSRAHTEVVGRYFSEGGVSFVAPEDKRLINDILLSGKSALKPRNGQIVVVKLIEYPTPYRQAIGELTEILGDHRSAGMEIEIAARVFGIPVQWPDAVLEQVEGMTEEVSEADKQDREDLRHLPLVTIDGEDARDFDDAVYCKRTDSGWRLWVAIADVAHYVTPGSALDREAVKRGTSVYFPDSVVPMLPEILSNGLCSLKPQIDRLCLVCEMGINDRGEIRRTRFYRAVMHSRARLTYTQVWAALQPDPATGERTLLPESEQKGVEDLYALYHLLHQSRQIRGAIDFDTVETKVVFDETRKISAIVPTVRNDAHRLIEECMIAANVAAARFLEKHKTPALFRVHNGPKPEKLLNLYTFLGQLGLVLGSGGDGPTPQDYAQLLARIKERPDFNLIQTVMLRSMSQAEYRPDNSGHFGLSLDAYCHFTSPIRRYPDLMVHRALIHLSEKHKPREFYLQHEAMAELGQHCSMTERRADEATRDAMQSLKCQFMLDHVGEEFDGVVSGVAAFGIFVELKDVYIEGLIHVTELGNDYFHFDPVSHRFTGERSGKSFRLADSIRVRVVRVDVEERKIDLARVATGEEPLRKRGRGRQESSVESTQHAQRKRSTKRSESKAGRAQPVSRSNERTEGKRKEGKRGDVKRTGAKPAEAKRMDGKRTGGGSTKTAPKSGARPASGKSQTAKRKN